MVQTQLDGRTGDDRVSPAGDVLAALGLAVLNSRRLRAGKHAFTRAERRADRAARLALRGLPVTQPPRP